LEVMVELSLASMATDAPTTAMSPSASTPVRDSRTSAAVPLPSGSSAG
jgi:hypothetical protein